MDYDVHLADLQRQPAAVIRAFVMPADLEQFLGEAFAEAMSTIARQGLRPVGPPFGRYVPQDGGGFELAVGFPVNGSVTATGRVTPDELPGGTVACTIHTGAYDEVGAAYTAATDWLDDNGFVATGPAWESYLDGPDEPHPRTQVFVPCQAMAHHVGA